MSDKSLSVQITLLAFVAVLVMAVGCGGPSRSSGVLTPAVYAEIVVERERAEISTSAKNVDSLLGYHGFTARSMEDALTELARDPGKFRAFMDSAQARIKTLSDTSKTQR